MKKMYTMAAIAAATLAAAQSGNVGINTTTPATTLDVTGVPADKTKLDGLTAPRLTGDQLRAKSYTSAQTGAQVYITAADSAPAGQTVNVSAPGYYYFDGSVWQKVMSGTTTDNAWNITGNAGTDPAVNFIGTTDDKDLIFRRNNEFAGKISTGGTTLGVDAMKWQFDNNGVYESRNVAIGTSALYNMQVGGYNVAVGEGALYSAIASIGNTAIGQQALEANSAGSNTALGAYALRSATGEGNIGIGAGAGVADNAGSYQMSIGNTIYGTDISNPLNKKSPRIGINTSAPAVTLDVAAKHTDGSNPEGFKTPQLTGDAVQNMTANLTAAQNGMIVFVTTPVTTADAATDSLTKAGHYRFDIKADGTGKNWVDMEGNGQLVSFYDKENTSNKGWEIKGFNNNIESTPIAGSGYKDYKTGKYAVNLSFLPNDLNEEIIYRGSDDTPASFSYAGLLGLYGQRQDGGLGRAAGSHSFTAGLLPTALGDYSVALGNVPYAKGYASVAIGDQAAATGDSSVALGKSSATGKNSFAVQGGSASGQMNIAINGNASGAGQAIAIGYGSEATNGRSIAIGSKAVANGLNSTALGYGSGAVGDWSFSQGYASAAYGANSVAIHGLANKENSMALFAEADAENSIVIGSSQHKVGIDSSSPTEKLDVNGNIRVRGDQSTSVTPGGACTNRGTITFYNDNFYGCKSTGWVQLNN